MRAVGGGAWVVMTVAIAVIQAHGLAAQASGPGATGRPGGAPLGPGGAASTVVLPTRSGTPVTVVTTADELTVVQVPMPAGFSPAARVNYTVTPLVEGAVAGRLTGSMAPSTPPDECSILLGIRSPRHALAGRVQVATARFSTSTEAVEVAIFAAVAARRSHVVQPAAPVVAARAGAAVPVGYRVANTGNVADSVRVGAVVPPGWRTEGGAWLVIAPRQAVDRSLALTPPPGAAGVVAVRLVATSSTGQVSEAQIDVHLPEPALANGNGPTLRAGVAAAGGPWDGVSTAQSVELQGPLSDGVSVLARASTSDGADAASYAFTRANAANLPLLVQLSSGDWRAEAGTIAASVSELAGVNLVGRGGSVLVRQPAWSLLAFRATPNPGGPAPAGSLTAARVEVAPGDFAVAASASSLREALGESRRSLDAWSLGGRQEGFLGGRWQAELARRRVLGRAHAGWSAAYDRRLPDENLAVRYVHAPGGTAAFARAASQLSVDGGRRLGQRLRLNGGWWRTRDDGGTALSTLGMDGWSAGGRMSLSRDAAVTITASRSAFQASTALGTFGNEERSVDAVAEHRRGAWAAQVTLSAASLLRRGTLDGAAPIEFVRRAPRAGLRAMVTASGDRGRISLTGQHERTGAGVGAAPVQWSYGVQAAGMPGLGFGDALHVDAGLERLGGVPGAGVLTTLRAALSLELPRGVTVRAGIERNPWVLPVPGASPWMTVVGLSRAVVLPKLSSGDTRGTVYRDENGNGRRDAGEPGIRGVALRRGADLAVTGTDGSYRFPGATAEDVEVDTRSLPSGWMVPSTRLPAGTRSAGAVAVVPLTVTLALPDADTSRASAADLAAVIVMARDPIGREWIARRTSDSTVVFDALPPGTYVVDVDASGAREPLRLSAAPPTVVVRARSAPAPLRLTLRARQLRFSSPRGTPST